MPNHPSIYHSFTSMQAWMDENAQGVKFRSPASSVALEHFSRTADVSLPESLKQLLMISDGETPKSVGAIGNWRWMPISEIQAAWGLLTQLTSKGAFDDLEPNPSPYLQPVWWSPAWLPIVSSDLGDFFCIDTNPIEPDRAGQIVLFLRDQPQRPLIAASLPAWLNQINQDLVAGLFTFTKEDGFNCEAFLWSALEGKHILDGLPGTLVV